MTGQNSQSKLDPGQTQQMIRFAVRKPWENADSISRDGVRTLGLLPQTNAKLVRSFSSGKSIGERRGLMRVGLFWSIGICEVDYGPRAGLDRAKDQIQT